MARSSSRGPLAVAELLIAPRVTPQPALEPASAGLLGGAVLGICAPTRLPLGAVDARALGRARPHTGKRAVLGPRRPDLTAALWAFHDRPAPPLVSSSDAGGDVRGRP